MTVTCYDVAKRYGITRRAALEWLNDRARLGMYKKERKLVFQDSQRYWITFFTLVESKQETDHATSKRTDGRRGQRRRDRRPVLSVG